MTRRLLFLNGVALVCAVFYHAVATTYVAMFWWADRFRPVTAPNFDQMGSAAYYGLRIVEQLVIVAIPAFIFVSGYFVAVLTGRTRKTLPWGAVRSRLVTLVIPYLVWSGIIFLTDFVLLDTRYSAGHYGKLLLVGGAVSAYYYVPLICQLYLLSPLLVLAARANAKLLLGAAFAVYLLVQGGVYLAIFDVPGGAALDLPGWAFPGYLIWFCAGIVAGLHTNEFKSLLARAKPFLPAAAAIFLVLGIVEWEWLQQASGQVWLSPHRVLSDELFSAVVILAVLAFEPPNRLAIDKRLSALAPKSYGVYLVHMLVLTWAAKVFYHLAPWVLALPFEMLALLVAAGIAVPLFLMELVQRSPLRNSYRYLFG